MNHNASPTTAQSNSTPAQDADAMARVYAPPSAAIPDAASGQTMMGRVTQWFGALAASCALLAAATSLGNQIHFNATWPFIFATACWAAWDSRKVRLQEYRSGIAASPLMLWFGVMLLWIVAFPLCLVARRQIQAGQLARKAGL